MDFQGKTQFRLQIIKMPPQQMVRSSLKVPEIEAHVIQTTGFTAAKKKSIVLYTAGKTLQTAETL